MSTLPQVSLPGDARFVSRLGLGGMMLSAEGRPDRETAKSVIQRAVEQGITFIDTADAYALDDSEIGHNERLIAEALGEMGLSAGDDSPIVVATKGGNKRPGGRWVQDGRPEHLREACHASLRALGVDRISLYHLHVPDRNVPLEDSIGELDRLREEGKIDLVGISNVDLEQARTAESVGPIASIQNYYSAWGAGIGANPVVRHCEARDMVFLAYSPLGGAGRAGALGESTSLRRLGETLGASPQELALAWLMAQSASIIPIPSATRTASVDSSARAARIRLNDEQLRGVSKALRGLPRGRGLLRRLRRRLLGR